MRMNLPKKTLLGPLAGACCLALFAIPGTASAQQATANFQGACNFNASNTGFGCTFDAQRPASAPSRCPGSFIWRYHWDFGDGTTLLTSSSVVSHAYAGRGDRFPKLQVICWQGGIPERTRHVCTTIGTLGCIKVDGTWY